jgi:hypothetical protein
MIVMMMSDDEDNDSDDDNDILQQPSIYPQKILFLPLDNNHHLNH